MGHSIKCKASDDVTDDVTDNVPGRLLWREHEKFGSVPGFEKKKKKPGKNDLVRWRTKIAYGVLK